MRRLACWLALAFAFALPAGALDAPRTIVYCGGGIAATTTAFAMALAGHDGWCVYDNSLLEWSADPARPMESGGV